jgi:hypothetical protein
MLIVVLGKLVDFALEVSDRVEAAAADRLLGDQTAPALDLVEPGAVGRRVVDVVARLLASQALTLACL